MSDIPQSATTEQVPGPSVTVPDHVVFRVFASETVVLNINTGQYHGLNPIAGRMLETLQRTPNLHVAARELAQEFDQAAELIEQDLRAFCDDLVSRRLLEISENGTP